MILILKSKSCPSLVTPSSCVCSVAGRVPQAVGCDGGEEGGGVARAAALHPRNTAGGTAGNAVTAQARGTAGNCHCSGHCRQQ